MGAERGGADLHEPDPAKHARGGDVRAREEPHLDQQVDASCPISTG